MFIQPMLAAALPKKPLDLRPGRYALEEKLDGHRLIIQIDRPLDAGLPSCALVTAWSRYGKERVLPPHLLEELSTFPSCIIDGELLVPGRRSYGVTELTNSSKLEFWAFDLLEANGQSALDRSYDERRALLETAFDYATNLNMVKRTPIWQVSSMDDVDAACKRIWAQDGEGVILKLRSARYSPGKRPAGVFVKFKDVKSAVWQVYGFAPSEGEIVNRGPFAVTLIEKDGLRTKVKTLNDATCRELESKATDDFSHPYIGRGLRIEYQELTPDGLPRHARWDRWEDE